MGNGTSLGWDMVNRLALTRIRSVVYCDSTYPDGVETLGVDKLCWCVLSSFSRPCCRVFSGQLVIA